MNFSYKFFEQLVSCNFAQLPNKIVHNFIHAQSGNIESRTQLNCTSTDLINRCIMHSILQSMDGAQSVLSISSNEANISFDIVLKESKSLAIVGLMPDSILFYNVDLSCYVEVSLYGDEVTSVHFYFSSDWSMLLKMKKHIDYLRATYTTKIKKDRTIFFLTKSNHGFSWLERELTGDSKNLTEELMTMNYGKDFLIHNKNITRQLNEKSSGLYIFNGMQGTGKTSYIQHLIGSINRDFLYVPESLIEILADPSFIQVLMEKENAVLILEDAERAILKRQKGHSSPSGISNLLNMSDGIIGNVIKMPIILTFNSDLEDLDPAILRKGRCNYKHTFDKLSVSDAQDLAKYLKKDMKITEPTALSDIYNYGE